LIPVFDGILVFKNQQIFFSKKNRNTFKMNKIFDRPEIRRKEINSGKNRDIQQLGKGQKQRVIHNTKLCQKLEFSIKISE